MSDLLSPILFDGYKVYKEAEQSVAGLIPEHVSAVLDVVVRHMRAEQSAQPPCGADGAVLVDISDVEERIGGMSPGDDDFAEGWNALLTLLRAASRPAAPVAQAVVFDKDTVQDSTLIKIANAFLSRIDRGENAKDLVKICAMRTALMHLEHEWPSQAAPVAPATVAVPDGFVLVPVKPTRAMIRAAKDSCWPHFPGHAKINTAIYSAMLAASQREGVKS